MWSGATGTADGVRDVTVDTQFSIASTTKAIAAAQVMQLVESGELGLDDLVADHLPSDIDFDTNGATIRNLLGHRSGIPDYASAIDLLEDPLRFWTPAELLAVIPAERKPVDAESEYANTNYLLLGLVVEEVTGRPFVEVLRDGVLGIDGVERLIYQPDEVPTDPIAFDDGRSAEWFESVGGFLPSLSLTSDGAAAAMASDSVSLSRWWRALCAGEIVSPASLNAMLPKDDWYGLGLGTFLPDTVGHFGSDPGGVSLAGCVPESGVVFAVLANRGFFSQGTPTPLINVVSTP
jgi:CubicO group peptidase (beta-lactamase class C family)